MQGIVLAGGQGIRLLPLTKNTPKALIHLAGHELYEYSVKELMDARVDDIVVVAPPGAANGFRTSYGEVNIVEQEMPGSLESAISAGIKVAEESGHEEVILFFTGFISAPRGMARSLLEFYASSGHPSVMSVVPVISGLETYGFVKLGRSNRVEAFGGKALKLLPSIRSGYVFAGAVAGSVDAIRRLADQGFEDGINSLASDGLIGAIVWHGDWVEIGYPWDLLDAIEVAMKLMEPRISLKSVIGRNVVIEGHVVVDEGAVILDGAIIKGPTYIGPGALIGYNTVVISSLIEAGAVVGDLATVKNSIVLGNALIGSHSSIESSVIGYGAKIRPHVHIESGSPKEVPERLRDMMAYTREPPRLGAVIAPGVRIESFTRLPPGSIVE